MKPKHWIGLNDKGPLWIERSFWLGVFTERSTRNGSRFCLEIHPKDDSLAGNYIMQRGKKIRAAEWRKGRSR